MLYRIQRKPRHTHIFAKDIDGHYVEPAWCSARRLLEVEDFGPPGSRILDPATGWGTILHSVQDAGYTAVGGDIHDRLKRRELGLTGVEFHTGDFLCDPPARDIGSIICNPPFDYIQEFTERGIEIAQFKVAILCLHRRLPAARWLQSLPLRTVYLLTPRPSMPPGSWIEAGNKPGGGAQDFCWLVFSLNWVHPPKLKWLHRDGGRAP
jgi:hypothetical protein